MKWINLEHLLLPAEGGRQVSFAPALDHEGLARQALQLAAGLQARAIGRIAWHLQDDAPRRWTVLC